MDQPLSTLDLPRSTVLKLQSCGLNYMNELGPSQMETLNLKDVNKAKTALDILKEEIAQGCVLSYNKELDKVLIDEIVPKRLVELTGLPGSGKSQVCFQLCISAQLPKNLGGFGGEVIYINSKKGFSTRRVKQLATNFIDNIRSSGISFEVTDESLLDHIYVINVYDFAELMACVIHLETLILDKEVRLVIIDGITGPAKHIEISKRTQALYQLLNSLQNLANKHEFAVVLTNDFTTRIAEDTACIVPCLGDSFFHRVNTRIILSKTNGAFKAELVKSPVKTPMTTVFAL